MRGTGSQAAWEAELPRIDRELDRAPASDQDGVPGSMVKDEIERLEAARPS